MGRPKGRKDIQDEFTNLPVSAQRKAQLRAIRDGKCETCLSLPPILDSTRCQKCLVKNRICTRKRLGLNSQADSGLGRPQEVPDDQHAYLEDK